MPRYEQRWKKMFIEIRPQNSFIKKTIPFGWFLTNDHQ